MAGGGYGFHLMLGFADHSSEALAGTLCPGNAELTGVYRRVSLLGA